VVSFEDLKAMGKAKPSEAVPPSPDDYTTIMYTSGTTGGPCMVCKLVDACFLEQSLISGDLPSQGQPIVLGFV
jgi:acyl-coenzyme A synthetase/AMP-(fatty) acid ligase